MNPEIIFKNAIKKHIDFLLKNLGYLKTEEYKGFISYKSSNNYLEFSFDWNRSYEFDCYIRFDDDDYEYPISLIEQKLSKNEIVNKLTFGKEYSEIIEEWVNDISMFISTNRIQELKITDALIIQIRNEFDKINEEYNRNINS